MSEIRTVNKIIILAVLLFVVPSVMAQKFKSTDVCYRWQTQVDVSLQRIEIDESKLSNAETLEGIGCLLKLKGNKKKARFDGYTRLNLNASSSAPKIKRPATVEIAALYYASYIFYNDWEHAGSVQIYDADTEKTNTKRNVERAYKSYQKWFQRVLEIGLEKAREQKLDPLEGSEVAWS
jgi:hypothetical protein